MLKNTFILLLIFQLLFIYDIKAAKPKADLIILGAKVHTMDKKRPKAQAIAIKDGKIIAVTKKSYKIEKYRGKKTVQVNARGKVVIPGFNDSHVHFMGIGNMFSSMNLRNINSPKDIPDKMDFYTRFLPKGRWILGGGWNQNLWGKDGLPTKDLIDEITREHPVFIYDRSGTMALANSLALKMAGIHKGKDEIEGGVIVRDETGEPTGVLKGTAMVFVKNVAPRSNTKLLEEVVKTASNYAAYLGVTSVQDVHSDYIFEVLKKVHANGKLKTRVYDCVPLFDWKKVATTGIKKANGDAFIRNGCLKGFSEGYPEAVDQIYGYVSNADKNDLQVMIHAIGGRSNDSVLSIYERVIAENGAKDRRFRMEHAYRFRNEDLTRYSKSNIITSLQPHLFRGGDSYRSLVKANTKIAFGSDSSITSFNPVYGIHDAVNKQNENLTVEEAVRFYTLGSAYAEFQEKVKGSITVGKVADIVMLSQDIFEIKPEKIRDTKIELTVVNGKMVFNRRFFKPLANPAMAEIP